MNRRHQAGLPLGQILVGDVRTRLKELPDASIDTVITSPPYFNLRQYGDLPEQFGLEASGEEWVANLVGVCGELARVLKPTGSMFLNVADRYSGHLKDVSRKKALMLAPQRLAIALDAAGWIIRNEIIWAKRNFVPSSVRDRFTNGHETIWFCTRSPKAFFDLDPVRLPLASTKVVRRPRLRSYQYLPDDAVPAGGQVDLNKGLGAMKAEGRAGHPLGKNPSDIWHLATANFREAHFATFPTALVERALLATCPERVCTACGTPWQRELVDRRQSPALGQLRRACGCIEAWEPGVVLDPFAGSATVAVVAEQYGRRWAGIELNPAYAELAYQRLREARRAA